MPLLSHPCPTESTAPNPSPKSRLPLWALVASLAAAAGTHLAVGVQHDFGDLHGTFFLVAGVIQAVAAAVAARRPTRRIAVLAAVGSAVLLATWFVERTPGVPGGDTLDPLAVAVAVAELVTVVVAIRLLVRPLEAPRRVPALAALSFVALVAVASAGFADGGHGGHHHSSEEQADTDGIPLKPSREPLPLRPLPVAPADDHHGSSPDDGVSEAQTPPAPVTAPAGGDHHNGEDASPHGH